MTAEREAAARRAIAMIDLTDLGDATDENAVVRLCADARTHHTAAVCVWPEHVRTAARELNGSGVAVATVVNFPTGDERAVAVATMAERAVADGADEIDVVLPWRAWVSGDVAHAEAVLGEVRASVPPPICLKVIIESGELASPDLIRDASRLAINAGADFVKTSTGKTPISATPEAVSAILDAVIAADRPIGLKVSGGIRTADQAIAYLDLVDRRMGADWATPATFRFGASGLLAALVDETISPA